MNLDIIVVILLGGFLGHFHLIKPRPVFGGLIAGAR